MSVATTETPGLQSLIHELIDSGIYDADTIAADVIDRLPVEDLRRIVLPVVRDEVRRTLRGRSRSIERSAFGGGKLLPSSPDALRDLARSVFALPDGRLVSWGTATAGEHRARAAWQRKLAGECVADAERHESAAAAIEAAGARCLAEIAQDGAPSAMVTAKSRRHPPKERR